MNRKYLLRASVRQRSTCSRFLYSSSINLVFREIVVGLVVTLVSVAAGLLF